MNKPKEKTYVINRQQILRILRDLPYYRDAKYDEIYQAREDREKELKRRDKIYQNLTRRLKVEDRRKSSDRHKRDLVRKDLLAEFITTTKSSPAFLSRLRKYIGEKS